MKTPLFAASTLVLSALAALPASATTFDPNNQISFTGGDIFCTPSASCSNTTGNVTTTYAAGSVTFTYANQVHTGDATGIFSAFTGSTPTFNNFNYLSSTTPFALFTDTYNGQSLIFNVSQLTYNYDSNASSLTVTGVGSYLLNGATVNDGEFTLTTQGSTGSRVTFSDTNSIAQAPEPASLALLGTGLVGMVGAVRRRRS